MPQYYSNLTKKSFKKSKKLKKFSILFVLSFTLILFALIINFSDIFSSIITNKNSLFYSDKIEVASYSVYAVSIKDFSNIEEASKYSEKVKEQGGAGYIYESGEKFVLLFGYPNLIEAKEIQNNFIELGYNSRIVNLKVDAISHRYKGENGNNIELSVKFFRNLYQELYQSCIEFDKNNLNKTQLNTLIVQNLTKISNFSKILENKKRGVDAKITNIITNKFEKIENLLKEILHFEKDDVLLTSKIKEVCLKIVLENAEMNKKINAV